MSFSIWFHAPLTCLHCGVHAGERETRLHTSSLTRELGDQIARQGDVLELDLDDFNDAYFRLRDPGDEPVIHALEQWECPVSHEAQWARIDFRRKDLQHYEFASAQTVALTPETLREAHFLSRNVDFWVTTHPGEETERILPLIKHLLP